MDPAGLLALIDAIHHMHGVEAKHIETTAVHEVAPTGETVWRGDVETFAVKHPKASRCFAWSEATTGTKRRFFAVLAAGAIDSPAKAVQASIVADAMALDDAKAKLS